MKGFQITSFLLGETHRGMKQKKTNPKHRLIMRITNTLVPLWWDDHVFQNDQLQNFESNCKAKQNENKAPFLKHHLCFGPKLPQPALVFTIQDSPGFAPFYFFCPSFQAQNGLIILCTYHTCPYFPNEKKYILKTTITWNWSKEFSIPF